MRKVTKDYLENASDHSFYLIGNRDRKDYYPAIIGLARDKSHVVYSFEKLVSCFMKWDGLSYEEAVEWIEYNIEQALPYYGELAPKILPNNFISSRNKIYEPIKIEG